MAHNEYNTNTNKSPPIHRRNGHFIHKKVFIIRLNGCHSLCAGGGGGVSLTRGEFVLTYLVLCAIIAVEAKKQTQFSMYGDV